MSDTALGGGSVNDLAVGRPAEWRGSAGDGGPRGSAGEYPAANLSAPDPGNRVPADADAGTPVPHPDPAEAAEAAGSDGSSGTAGARPGTPWFGVPSASRAAAAHGDQEAQDNQETGDDRGTRGDQESGGVVTTRVPGTTPAAVAPGGVVTDREGVDDREEDVLGESGEPDTYAVESAPNRTLQPLLLHSLAELREIWVPLLRAADIRSVAEIGSESGAATSLLVDLLRGRGGGKLVVIDPDPGVAPEPGDGLEVDVVRGYSPQALVGLAPVDAYLIDGDHNYATVTSELETIADAARATGRPYLPLLIMHDVGWPNARRDSYYTPERIPEPERQPYSWELGVRLDSTGAVAGGLRGEGAFAWARSEGGAGNGVRTAVEDFLTTRPELRLFVAAPIFGLGIVVDDRAPYAERVDELLRPWVRNSLLTRLERNRLDLYLHVLLLQDEMIDAARRRQREWARLDAALADRATTELRLLDAAAEAERALDAERATAQQLRAALADEPKLVHAARVANAALKARLGGHRGARAVRTARAVRGALHARR
ncbi:class I SAM-dependent methyltransferase [Candidatus Protofrankia datiscae]|uniref:class I SAM-dependent methyltransferase n=2 Tax=Frankiaceae TaxID=74712 RepID=UPI001ED96C25|nr:class I SAM-dependent methyltransferase [Candidatus Protofrankia datiscae]